MEAHLRRGHEGERGVRTVRSEAAAEDERVKAESDDRSLPTAVWTAPMRELFRSVWSNEGGALEVTSLN